MRKSTKVLLGIGALVATPIIINHVIAKKAAERIEKAAAQSADEQNVYEWDYGNIRYNAIGEGKPLLLLHGLYPGADRTEWEHVIELFAQNYKVYAPDLLGFGYSDKPAIDYCNYLFVRLIKDFAENVISEPVTAVASLHTAAALVSCASLNPEDFEKIILVSPTGLEAETPLAQDEDSMAKKALESPIFGTSVYNALCSKKGLTEFYKKEGLGEFTDDAQLEKIYLSAHAEGANGKYAIAALLGKFFNTDIKETLANLEVPHDIIVGDTQPQGSGFTIYNGMCSDIEAKTIEGAGLLPHICNPEEVYNTCK